MRKIQQGNEIRLQVLHYKSVHTSIYFFGKKGEKIYLNTAAPNNVINYGV